MENPELRNAEALDLRRRAEAQFQATQAGGTNSSPEDENLRLLHELQVHQIELELQNDELVANRAQLELSLEKYADLYDFAPVGYFMLDSTGCILEVNLAGAALCAVERAYLIGRNFGQFVAFKSKPLYNAFLKSAVAGPYRETCEISLATPGPMPTIVQLDGVAMDAKVGRQCRVAVIDVSERKQKEDEIRELNMHLEERVQARTHELAAANTALVDAMRLKDEFVANVSHELRTPLTGILTLSEVLQEEINGQLNPAQRKYVGTIKTCGTHLLSLINDILDFSRMEAHLLELAPAPFAVEDLCTASVRLVAPLAEQKHMALHVALAPPNMAMIGDYRRLVQALVNLLGNAIKFTPNGGTVWLRVAGDFRMNSITFSVEDTGMGIAEADIQRIFQPFVQLDGGLARQFSGTGLGLALVRRIAELHGGHAGVESVLGEGSQFFVALPWRFMAPADHPFPSP